MSYSVLDHMHRLDKRNKDAYARWIATKHAIAMWRAGWPRYSIRHYPGRAARAWAAVDMAQKAQRSQA